jgi:Right handed beta helix region
MPGDTVVIMPGTYHESINLTRSGTATAPITFEAQTTGTVTIDATGFSTAFGSNFGNTQYITFKGINIKNCANSAAGDIGALTTGTGWVLQDVVVDGADGLGIDIWGDNVTLLRVTAQNCGCVGLNGDGATNVTVTDCVTCNNNTKGNDPNNNAGAGKWARCDHVTIDNLNSYGNTGPGLWFDYNNTNIVVKNSQIHDNKGLNHDYEGMGMSMELDQGPILIENNQFYGNTGSNICVQSSRNVTIQNNSLKGTALEFRDYPRGADYTDQNFNVYNNTFDNTQIMADGGTWDATSAATKQITFAGNTYLNTPAVEFNWGTLQLSLKDGESTFKFESTPAPTTAP